LVEGEGLFVLVLDELVRLVRDHQGVVAHEALRKMLPDTQRVLTVVALKMLAESDFEVDRDDL
jgi:hypothetical protein